MKRICRWLAGCVLMMGLLLFFHMEPEAAVRIHYIALNGSTDAILLEDNGHFGIVDSGEDWDYPNADTLKYPLQVEGINRNSGFEQQVIYYLSSVGVNASNLEFYIGTHAHSDHIGSGDEIINKFKPKILYLKEYDDHRITNMDHLWDNQYIYWNLIKAARENQVTIVQDLSEGMTIRLGDHTELKLYNTEIKDQVGDENANAIVTEVTIWNRSTLLTSDIQTYTARELLEQGVLGETDILKLPHHGYYFNNSSDLLIAFSPKTAIITGALGNLETESRIMLDSMGTDIRSVISCGAATVTSFTAAGYTTEWVTVESGWFEYLGKRYYMDSRGRVQKEETLDLLGMRG